MIEKNKSTMSEENFRRLLDFVSDSILVINQEGVVLTANEGLAKFLGLDSGKLLGKHLKDSGLFDSKTKMLIQSQIKKRIKGEEVENFEIPILVKGEVKYVEPKGNRIDYFGEPADLIILHDVTNRKKKADEQIRSSEEKYKNLFENAPDVIVAFDLTGKITSVNKAIMQFGFKKNEIVGSSVFKLVQSEYTPKMQAGLKSIAAGNSAHNEIEIDTPTGKKSIEYNSNPIWLNDKVVGYQTIIRDVTERKKADESLGKEQQELNRIIDSSPIIIFYKDKEGKFIRVNKAFAEALKIPKEKFIGKTVFDLYSAEIARGMTNDDLEVLESGLSKCGIIEQYESASGLRWVQTDKVPILDKKGISTGLIGFALDITERKKAEEERKKSEEKYRKLFEESLDAIFVADADSGIIVDCNAAASKLVGREKSELVGQHQSFIHPREQMEGEFTGGFQQHVKDLTKILETQIIMKTGEIRDVSIKGTIFELNGKKLMQGTFRDITELKLIQHALQESEEKFRTITNSVKDSIILVDDQTKVVYWNPAAEKTFGYTNTEAIGKKIHELVVPETISPAGREYIRTGVRQFANTGNGAFTDGNIELLGQRKDGTEFPAKISLTPIKLNGKWSAVGVVKDITERKQAEQKLKEAEKRYHALFNEAPLGVLVIDPQTVKFVEFNDVACAQLGYSREEFSKLRLPDIAAISTDSEIRAHNAKIIREGRDEFEAKQRTKNGESRNVLVNVKAVELAGQQFLFCVFHDITEIRKVQNALMESETKYRQLVNVAQEGIWAFDKNYQTIFVNPKMAQMLGCSENELAGKSIFEFLKQEHIEQASSFLGEFKKGFSGHFDYSFARKNGSCIDVSIIASVINDDEGKPVGTLAMVSDITDRKILERKVDNYSKHLKSMVELRTAQLKNANEQLVKSERLAAIGELAGMVGHDLRNPLTGIKNAAYYLKKKGTTISEVQAKEMLETIDKSIDHANRIINDLLDYSREMHLELTEYALSTLLNDALRMIQVPDRIQIVNHVLGETLVKVEADKIMRVFINIIKNAIDAMPEKGTLEIKSRQTKESVEISFVDTGTGISKETLQKLFTPLFTTKAQGMGFGLAICKRIVEAHRGTITLETEVNKGTTFKVTLPIKPTIEVRGEKTWVNMPKSLLLTQ